MFSFIKKIKLLGTILLLGSYIFIFGKNINTEREILNVPSDEILEDEWDIFFARLSRLDLALREGDLRFIDTGVEQGIGRDDTEVSDPDDLSWDEED